MKKNKEEKSFQMQACAAVPTQTAALGRSDSPSAAPPTSTTSPSALRKNPTDRMNNKLCVRGRMEGKHDMEPPRVRSNNLWSFTESWFATSFCHRCR